MTCAVDRADVPSIVVCGFDISEIVVFVTSISELLSEDSANWDMSFGIVADFHVARWCVDVGDVLI